MADRKKRDHYKDIIMKMSRYLNGVTDDVTGEEISTQYDRCVEAWRSFQDVHLEILQVTGDEFMDFEKTEFDAIEEVIVKVIPKFRLILRKFNAKNVEDYETANSSNHADDDVIDRNNGGLRVPYFKIPMFSGNYDSWPAFKDLFRSMIHFNKKMSPVQKLGYLKVNLTGEALKIINNLEITDANYENAWDLLTDRYDNKRLLVNRWIQLIFQIPLSKGAAVDIKAILDGTQEALQGLRNLNRPVEYYDDLLVYLAETKLDSKSKERWEDEIAEEQNAPPTWQRMVAFLKTRFRSLEVADQKAPEKASNQPINAKVTYSKQATAVLANENQDNFCPFCKNKKHRLTSCFSFQKKPFCERRAFVDENKLCLNCLIAGHKASSCPNTYTCRVCQQRHHTLLHVSKQSSNVTSNVTLQANGCRSNQEFTTLLATALVHVKISSGVNVELRALVDQGSQISFITRNAAKRLGLKINNGAPAVKAVGMNGNIRAKGIAQLTFFSRFGTGGESNYQISVVILDRITGQLPSENIDCELPLNWKKLALADPKFYQAGNIDLLVGADVVAEILQSGLLRIPDQNLIAQSSTLGWLLSGRVKLTNPVPAVVTGTLVEEEKESDKICERLRAFWEIENVGQENVMDPDDQLCEEHFQNTHYRDETGRFVVRLPFKPSFGNFIHLGNSRNIAIYNWLAMEKRMRKSPDLRANYNNIMGKLIANKFMQLVSSSELQVSPSESCYLIHHIVNRGGKSRIVFNASKKTSSGFSLNDALLVGPPLQRDLFDIIVRVRQFRIAFSADVVKMFRQFAINKLDVDYQRFVYRNNEDEGIKDYRLVTVLDGTASASYLANKIILTLAQEEKLNFPLASKVAERDMYVDDLLSGCHDIETGIATRDQLNSLFRSAGMELSKWASNNTEFLATIPSKSLETPIMLGEDDVIKTLGVFWSPQRDEFGYQLRLNDVQARVTKRQLLSEASKLFDPAGWVAPCIIIPKILFQSLWSTPLGWDDFVPSEVQEEWLAFRKQLPCLENLKIPRWTGNTANDKLTELHGFSDASQKGYAAVVYIRNVDANDVVTITMLTAKTKVAPIKTISLPRLELCGALLLAHLLEKTIKAMHLPKVKVHAHTDSQIVLAWLQSPPNRWKTFIANRTSEILRIVSANQWHHVQSKENPADCASRGLCPSMIANHSLWWNGPDQLRVSNTPWPMANEQVDLPMNVDMEERRNAGVVANVVVTANWDLRTKYSSLTRLLRVSAYCFRFINNCRRTVKTKGCITSNELDFALRYWIQVTQEIHFKDEIDALQKQKQLPNNSNLLKFRPILDKFNLLRIGGRLTNSDLPFERQHPIVLPKDDHFTTLIVDFYHRKTLHGNIQILLNCIRDKYWILNGRSVVRSWVHRCNRCYRFSSKTTQQLMGDLPSARGTPSRSFSHSALDYAGPFKLKLRRGPGRQTILKSYASIFVCMATRAVHLELVGDLTADAFISAFKRFVARRGHVSDIYSDNGSNFVAANEIMSEDHRQAMLDTEMEFAELLANDGVTWHFSPPSAPHFNGLAEAGVRSLKYHLRRIIGSTHLTFEEFSTVLCQIEAVLNSRPISALTDDFSNFAVLTPGHFLMGSAPILPPEPTLLNVSENRLSRWQLLEQMKQRFWKVWSSDYLASLQQRPRWRRAVENLSVGQLVIIRQDNLPPVKWLLGRIEAIHPGRDGLVRVATVRTQSSTLERPVVKLCPLPSPRATQEQGNPPATELLEDRPLD